jgi:serine/threonine-protein kinase
MRARDGMFNATSAEEWERVRELAERALELPREQRAAFLCSATDDQGLLVAAEALVTACERAEADGDFLARPATAMAAPMFARDVMIAALRGALAGRYTLEREAGRGGMATVFLARDERHARPVAVKVLDPELHAVLGAERFLAEIRVTARLQHPNLLPLFDSGEAAGLLYYVMPFVEGESLRARLRRERELPVEEAVRITVVIAGALDYAHRHGVIHRDLKPENILLHDGEPLVGDFGIALALSRAEADVQRQHRAAFGTPRYMSPEQSSADRVLDARSDVYALACVLYEMLSGKPARDRTAAGNAAVPDVRAHRPSVPAHVAAALDRALSRLPADRFASARDFAAALTATRGATQPAANRAWTGGMLTAAAIGIAALGWLAWRNHEEPAPSEARFVVNGLSSAPVGGAPVLSPDGRMLVYAGPPESGRQLIVRPLDSLGGRPIPGTRGVISVFTSPDGRSLAYYDTEDRLLRVRFDGGVPIVLAPAFRFGSASWTTKGVIVTDGFGLRELAWIPEAGGAPHPLTRRAGERDGAHVMPFALPDGRAVVFTVQREGGGPNTGGGELAIVPLDTAAAGPARHVMLGVRGFRAVAMVDDWLVYVSEDRARLTAIRLDEVARRVHGAPVTVLEDADGGIESASLAADGTLLYTRRRATKLPMLVGADGVARQLDHGPVVGEYMNPRLSPDGRRLVLGVTTARGNDIWVYDLASGTPTRITAIGTAVSPTWSPDGRRVIYLAAAGPQDAVWRQSVDGSGSPELLVQGTGLFAPAVTPDGRTLVYQQMIDRKWVIKAVSVDGDRTPRTLVAERSDSYMPAVSPDGRWLAYVSNASGHDEIFVRPFGGAGAATLLSDSGGTEPVWSRDGRRVYYRDGHVLRAASISTIPALAVRGRTALATDTFEGNMPHVNYDVTGDGRLVMVASERGPASESVVAVGWGRELHDRVSRAP